MSSTELEPNTGMEDGSVADILVRIVKQRQQRIRDATASERPKLPEREPQLQTAATNPFLGALSEKRGKAVIAEIKMGSPSLGSLVGTFEPLELARTYARSGAAALSVVVEPDFFHGSYELLAACHEASGLPAIAKDFVVDPLQLRWAKRAGASAVLLVAALYEKQRLHELATIARGLGLVPLVETHDLSDLMKLEGGLWELVGVNNRDLRTFTVELGTSLALRPSLPTGSIKVAESGIHEAGDVQLLRSSGFDAFLIGEALVTSGDPATKLRELSA